MRGDSYTFFKSKDKREIEENSTQLQNVRQKAFISNLSCRAAVSAMLYQTKTISTGFKAANLLSYRVEQLDTLSKFTTVLHRYLANKRIKKRGVNQSVIN